LSNLNEQPNKEQIFQQSIEVAGSKTRKEIEKSTENKKTLDSKEELGTELRE
jgi:hypothetical protein